MIEDSSAGVILPCSLDALDDRRAAILQLTQIAEALFELAQLGVIESAGALLAIARDERHARALVEQPDGGRDLLHADAQFRGDALVDLVHDTPPPTPLPARLSTTRSRAQYEGSGAREFENTTPASGELAGAD